jgi:curved DNA-binding protein CbpA
VDLYAVLGVSRTAGAPQIKTAYRAAAKKCHPDAGGDPVMFQQVSIAYTVLSDPEKRAHYDRTGSVDRAGVENVMAGVAQCFAEMLDQVLTQTKGRMSEVDLAASIKRALSVAHENIMDKISDACLRLEDLEDIQKRLRRRDDEPNVFVDILSKRIQGAAQELAMHKANKVVAERALLELQSYESPVDAMRSMMGMMYGTASTSTGSSMHFYRVQTG